HVYKLVAYDAATGQRVGATEYGNGGDDFASDLAISGDGSRLAITGTDGTTFDYLTAAFDASTLKRQWAARYDRGHGVDSSNAVAISPDGRRVYVTGESEQGKIACFGDVPSTAYATVAYRAGGGGGLWISRYVGLVDAPDEATEVAVAPDSTRVFVT